MLYVPGLANISICRVGGGAYILQADLSSNLWVLRLLTVFASPFIGSVLGVLIRRLPRHEPVVVARSACESCGVRLQAWQLVPIVSFLALRGRCHNCGARIARAHLVVELAAIVVAVLAMSCSGDAADMIVPWGSCVLGWLLLALGWIDAESLTLPDVLTLPLLVAGLGWCVLEQPDELTSRALGAALSYTVLTGLSAGYHALRGRPGLGAGDAKLTAACAAWLGVSLMAPLFLSAALLGMVLLVGLRLSGAKVSSQTKIPFGPCIGVAAWSLRLWWANARY